MRILRKKPVKLFLSLLVIMAMFVSSLAGLTGCAEKKDPDAIYIGVISPTSGSMSQYGKDIVNSFRLAVEEINAAGGILGKKVKLYEQDDAGSPATAVTAASKITSYGVDFIAGGYASGCVTPILQQIYDENIIFLVANANSRDITKAGLNQTFMINSPGTHAVVQLTRLLKYLGSKNVALIHQGDSYTQDLSDICKEELPKSGFNIATVELMPEKEPDVSPIVTSIISSGADFVYWCGYDADGSNVIKQLRQGGYTGEIAVGDGSASINLIEACGDAGEGVYVTSPPFVEFSAGGEKFMADYNKKFGLAPGTYATVSYDTIYLLKAAIEKAGTIETEKVRDALQNIEFKGLSGTIKFTPDREPEISNFIVLQIKGGKFILVEP